MYQVGKPVTGKNFFGREKDSMNKPAIALNNNHLIVRFIICILLAAAP